MMGITWSQDFVTDLNCYHWAPLIVKHLRKKNKKQKKSTAWEDDDMFFFTDAGCCFIFYYFIDVFFCDIVIILLLPKYLENAVQGSKTPYPWYLEAWGEGYIGYGDFGTTAPSTSFFVVSLSSSCCSHFLGRQSAVLKQWSPIPIGSMYCIFTYIWLIFRVNVGKYTSPMDPMGYTLSIWADVKSNMQSIPSWEH